MRLRAWVFSWALASCGDVAMPSGEGGFARIPGAAFVAGERPAVMGDERVTEVQSPNNEVRAGQRAKALAGRATGGAYTVAIGLDGDNGYWVVPMTARSVLFPGELEWQTLVDFDASLPPGPRALWIQAGDALGRFGPAQTVNLTVRSTLPSAPVVVSLRWDVDADLNLLVVQPDGSVVSNRGVRSADGAAVTVDPRVGPALDLDSNARCARDGRRVENIAWGARTPGRYVVRVEAWSLCGLPSAHYTVTAYDRGAALATAQGAAFDAARPTTGSSVEVIAFELAP